MQKPENVQPAIVPVVRVLRLRRRRTNVPWIYSLYHVDPKPPRRRTTRTGGEDQAAGPPMDGQQMVEKGVTGGDA
jgi:hypothetical protein